MRIIRRVRTRFDLRLPLDPVSAAAKWEYFRVMYGRYSKAKGTERQVAVSSAGVDSGNGSEFINWHLKRDYLPL